MQRHVIELVAARAAELLGEWIGLSPFAKSDNGDESSVGGLAMVLGAMLAAKAPPPPPDAVERMRDHILADIAGRAKNGQVMRMTYDVDYGPGRELSRLAESCEIKSSWPIKSHLTIYLHHSKTSIYNKRNYGAEGLTHYLIDGRGWIVSPSTIDARVLPIVLAAIDRGDVSPDVARLEPFKT